ncbi:ABC transporter permease [Bradyrhizobium canariense]|uniref:ABC transporter permease n=1 Tax=Bradyrhizobium canariense TaxID=255045 RepID=A0A1X3FZD6_9BRAD|nr:ABC transporter permease [Bradyrhizobium canariense]OSI80539.1 ABC transporter permease [Bradyrhizobium canariense]OSI91141.1 ABC transporter permease [Bradyrhizobium canariense]OSI96890.1 ABC transporter permease [Bradyrhizobium canariense]OSJ09192.1 ABC transporter permease [Bradyrhizobium canariense]
MSVSAGEGVNNLVERRTPGLRGIGRWLQATAAGRVTALALLVAVLAFLSVYPLSMLLYGSLHSTPPGMAGTFNLDGYRDVITLQSAVTLLNTVGISLAKTIPSVILAVLLAWILARTDTPFRGALEVLITLPFFIPPILTAMAWGMLGNPQVGLLNQLYQWVTGWETGPINVYSYGGVVWHMMQYSVPFLFLLIVDAFRAMDPSLEEAATMCGASRLRTFRTVTLQLMLPALTGAAILSFIRGIENFESPLFFGSPAGIRVITTDIYDSINQRSPPQYQYATASSFVIMALLFLIVVLQRRMLRGRSFQTITGKGYSPSVMKLGAWRWATFAFCVLFFVVTVVLPVGQLIIGSFFKFFGFYQWDMLTLEHYQAVFGSSEFWRGFSNTMFLGLIGATLTMFLGATVAYVSARTKWRGRLLIDSMAWLPWMMPGIVLGVGFLWGFALLPHGIPIYGTIWALLLAYVSLGTPLSVRAMSSAYAQLSFDLEECSRVHGASWLQTMRRIVLALAWPSFAVGWVLVFFGIMRELSASVLLYSVGSEVLSVVLLKLWANGNAEQVSVIGLIMMFLVILFRWVQLKFISNRIGGM